MARKLPSPEDKDNVASPAVEQVEVAIEKALDALRPRFSPAKPDKARTPRKPRTPRRG